MRHGRSLEHDRLAARRESIKRRLYRRRAIIVGECGRSSSGDGERDRVGGRGKVRGALVREILARVVGVLGLLAFLDGRSRGLDVAGEDLVDALELSGELPAVVGDRERKDVAAEAHVSERNDQVPGNVQHD